MIRNIAKILFLTFLMAFFSGCVQIFELDADVQARKALKDLMSIQEAYHKENGKYARNLTEITKYNLKYHAGIVYLEIESAGKDAYRAISLPAESTTARVFAYDTAKGGFYEMGEEEVSQYVLGALNFIRDEQGKKRISNVSSYILLGILLALGIRIASRYMDENNRQVFLAYFLSLLPLLWSITVLNNLNPEIVISNLIIGNSATSLILAIISLVLGMSWFLKTKTSIPVPSAIGILLTTVVISLFSSGVMVHTFVTYF
jgi:hypothetical protein